MKLYIFSILFVLVSCSQKAEHDTSCQYEPHPNVEHSIIDTLTLKNTHAYTFNDFAAVKTNAEQTIVYLHSEINKNIKGCTITDGTIVFEKDYQLLGQHIKDYSVFDNGDALYLTDYPYCLLKHSNKSIDTLLNANNGICAFTYPFLGDKLNFTKTGDVVTRLYLDNEENPESHLFKKINNEGIIVSQFASRPPEFINQNFPLLEAPSKLDLDSISLISYGFHHFINAYNNNKGTLIKRYCVKSNYITSNIKGIPTEPKPAFQQVSNQIITAPFYLGLYYDQFNKRYYRIVKHAQELKNKDYRLNSRYDGNWSIIILNDQLIPIGEAKMPANTYYYYSCFVGEKGLYVALKQPQNKSANFVNIKFHINEKTR